MTTGGTDNSTLDAISLLYNGLINGVKTYGAVDPDGNPYIVRLDWFQKDYQSKNINTIVVIPKDSTFELPIIIMKRHMVLKFFIQSFRIMRFIYGQEIMMKFII